MTKVKVDIQLVATGGVGDGKSLVLRRILKAIKCDEGLQSICKIHQARCFDTLRSEQAGLSFEGELLPNAGPKAPKETHSNVPGYPDTDKMINYLVAKLNETASSEIVTVINNATKTEPLKMIVRGTTGVMVSYREDKFLRDGDRVVTLLTAAPADASADPVGMDWFKPQTDSTQASGHEPLQRYAHLVNGWMVAEDIGEFVRFDEVKAKTIILTKAELQSKLSRVKWAEGLIRQLPKDHDGRNSWLKNYGQVPETETGAPEPDAHSKAAEMYRQFEPSVQAKFFTNWMDSGCVYPGGLVAGNLVQVITTVGNVLVDNVSAFHWSDSAIGPVVKYYRKL